MARVKLDMPERIVFTCIYRVGISDINYGNHLGNDRILTIAHDARLRFVKSLGYRDELSFGEVGIVQTDAEVVYKAEAFHGDELEVRIALGESHRYGLEMYYEIVNKETELVVSLCKTGILFFDYSQKKPVEFPPDVRNKLYRD